MASLAAYRWLCGVLGAAFVLGGFAFVAAFFSSLLPDAPPLEPIPVGPGGAYFVAFAGCGLVGWGGSLIGAARRPETGRATGTATAFALVLMALYRMAAWLMGDYAYLGELLRVEAAVLLVLALGFVWLRPAAAPST